MPKPPEALDPSIWHPELLAGPLRGKRLTVLYGAPGPLRDGMIRRGLMPLLRQPPSQAAGRARRQVPIRFDGWGPLPLQALRTRIDAEFTAVWPQGAPETLAAHLSAIGRTHQATVLLVLDAFERHLGERAERHDIERFDIELSESITQEAVPLHVLMVVDELENRALQRYTRWIADFGDEFVRLPSLLSGEHDAVAWRDTDIMEPPEGADDESAPDDSETDTDWPVDLLLDVPAPAAPTAPMASPAAPAPMAPPASPAPTAPRAPPASPAPMASTQAPMRPPPPTPAAPPMAPPPVPAVEPPTVAPVSFSTFETQHGGAASKSAAPRNVERGVPRGAPARRIEPAFGDEAPGTWLPHGPEPPPAPPPRAAAPAPFGAWPPLAPPMPASGPASMPAAAPRSVPPWLSAAEVEHMRRMHEPSSRWPGLLGLALYMVALFAGAWWVANWIIDSQRVETRPRAPDNAAAARAPPPPNAARTTPQAAAPSAAPATPPATARTLTLALPADAGSALPLVDELIRRVAAPAGLELRTAAGNEPASLALLRTDALLEARATSAAPLQVVAPLYSEQIQVLVRNDARWDYVREIRGLRLNIGRADGARARTARALYQQLFGTPLPAAQANELELDAALQALQQRGGPIDAVFVISDAPIVSHMQPALRKQVRELTISARDANAVTAMPAFTISRRTASDRARLATTTYLVAPGAPPRPQDAALRQLAAALCRAQPALQTQNSALLRGWRQGQQPDVGWPYVLPRTPNAACPAP